MSLTPVVFQTVHFGRIQVDEASTIQFSEGLPGFESRRRFALLQYPAYGPLVFLQSLELAGLCFPALPVGAVRPDYSLAVTPEDLEKLGLPQDRQPIIGRDVAALAILCLPQGETPDRELALAGSDPFGDPAGASVRPVGPPLHVQRAIGPGGNVLVIGRRKGEKILIGEGVEIEVIECGRGRVKLGIHAPKSVLILRDELRATREQNLAAALALEPGVLSGVLKNLKPAGDQSGQEIGSSQELAAPPSLPA